MLSGCTGLVNPTSRPDAIEMHDCAFRKSAIRRPRFCGPSGVLRHVVPKTLRFRKEKSTKSSPCSRYRNHGSRRRAAIVQGGYGAKRWLHVYLALTCWVMAYEKPKARAAELACSVAILRGPLNNSAIVSCNRKILSSHDAN